jgi:hypothetical protein
MDRLPHENPALKRHLIFLAVALSIGCGPQSGTYDRVTVGECGVLHIGGNTIAMYGIKALDCTAVEDALSRQFDGVRLSVQSGACWLRGEGANARFAHGCSEVWDQYDSILGNTSDWVVPNSLMPTLEPVRDDAGAIVANVWDGDQNLQLWLIKRGLVTVTCQPQDLEVGFDACERLLHAANLHAAD